MFQSIIVCGLLVVACGGNESKETAVDKKVSGRGEACIAFIDMSKSLPPEAFSRELQSLRDSFMGLSESAESYMQIYPLHGSINRGVPPVVNSNVTPNLYSGDRKLTAAYRQNRQTQWQQYEQKILNLRQELMQAPSNPLVRTCIIDAFSYAERFFKTKNNVQKKRLILASDMLEDCPARGIDMDNSAEEFRRSTTQANNGVAHAATYLSDVEIKIFAPGGPNGILALPAGVSVTELEEFWRAVLMKFGASEENISLEII